MKLNESRYTICPFCNSIRATETHCPMCNRNITPEDWQRKRERIEHLNEREGEWTRQGARNSLGKFANMEVMA